MEEEGMNILVSTLVRIIFFAKVRLIIENLCVDRRVQLWSFRSAQYHVTNVITALSVLTTEVDVSGVRQRRWALAFISTVVRGVNIVNLYAVLHIVFGVY
jgi:hypothetical protein